MADILVTCAHCGAKTAVSEYVDPDMAACGACGEKLNVPRAEVFVPAAPPPRPTSKEAPLLERTTTSMEASIRKRRKRIHERMKITAWSPSPMTIWIIFIVGSLTLGITRYVILPSHHGALETVKHFGPIVLLILHLTVCVDAFAENVMNGVIALFVPGYSLFYLYTQCDSYILRLAVGIMVVPCGQDSFNKCVEIVKWVIGMLEKATPS